ncbi:MarR family winged helix-turn-helix transcriptional regulator [Rhodovibrionaceae bacterium A322]
MPALEAEEVLDFLQGFWRLQNESPLFRVRNRDWPWLAHLHRSELSDRPVTIGEICGILNVSYPTARKIMAGFEDMGYIRSDRDSFDKRKSIVRLTELGRREMEKFEQQIAGALKNLGRQPGF